MPFSIQRSSVTVNVTFQRPNASHRIIELSTRHNFAFFSAIGSILRGWAWSASGKAKEGILCIENGIQDYLALGSRLGMPYWLGLKAEALYLAHRTSEALESIEEAIG